MNDIDENQQKLQQASKELIETTNLIRLLKQLGNPIQSGSSMTGLMVHPDIDFAVVNEKPNIQVAIDLVPTFFKELNATEVKVTDFRLDNMGGAVYYVGIKMPFADLSWKIDATVTLPGYDPADDYKYLYDISTEEREAILRLKSELIKTRRYVGARSQPPFTFKSLHVYKGVIDGKVRTIQELENYYK